MPPIVCSTLCTANVELGGRSLLILLSKFPQCSALLGMLCSGVNYPEWYGPGVSLSGVSCTVSNVAVSYVAQCRKWHSVVSGTVSYVAQCRKWCSVVCCKVAQCRMLHRMSRADGACPYPLQLLPLHRCSCLMAPQYNIDQLLRQVTLLNTQHFLSDAFPPMCACKRCQFLTPRADPVRFWQRCRIWNIC